MNQKIGHSFDRYDRAFPDRLKAKTSFAAIEVSHHSRIWHTAGCLREPESAQPRAAIVIVHGSGGVDSRGQCAATALNEAGFVTFEIDLWAARGVTSPLERPKTVAETLPDAFAALDFLTHRQGVDAARLGIMGFSIANALNAGGLARAQMATVLLGIPDPTPLSKGARSGSDMIELIRDLHWSGMIKANWDPDEHPRWPTGAPDSQGGQFAPKGTDGADFSSSGDGTEHRDRADGAPRTSYTGGSVRRGGLSTRPT